MKNPKSVTSRSRRLRFLPTPRDRLVLEAIRTHGRLTREQIHRLFFRKPATGPVSRQAVNARLHKLASLGVLEAVVVNGGHGSGPYAYGLGSTGRQLLSSMNRSPRGRATGAIWHLLEIAELRVRLQEELEVSGGELAEWVGEAALRSLLHGRRDWPVPDALVHWRHRGREGTYMLEWDRGTETLAVLTAKLSRYMTFWRSRGQRQMLPGLGLKPQLVIVLASAERASRLQAWLAEIRRQPFGATILLGVAGQVLAEPLAAVWWRSDLNGKGRLTSQ